MLMAAFGSRPPALQTVTFNANTTFPMPAGVSVLASVVGHGAAGAPAGTQATTTTVTRVTYHTSGTAGSGGAQWDSYQGLAGAVASDLTASGSASFIGYTADVYPDETNTLSTFSGTISGAVGTAVAIQSSGWRDSGHISTSGTDSVYYSRMVDATTGASATGFGKTFAGGTGGAATVGSYSNVAVTPGSNYDVVVPAGATVQITYYT